MEPEIFLKYLNENEEIDSYEFSILHSLDHQIVVGIILKLECLPEIIVCKHESVESLILTDEAKSMMINGSHEFNFYQQLPLEGLLQSKIKNMGANASVGFSKAMTEGWIKIDKNFPDGPLILRNKDVVEDSTKKVLTLIHENNFKNIPMEQINILKKRKLVSKKIIKKFIVSKGAKFSLKLENPETDLTDALLIDDAWRNKTFKEYNFEALGIDPCGGSLHPLLEMRNEFIKLFINMGFEEMPTNNYVESSFWNFDSLFQPQQHPARDAQDTFFLTEPSMCDLSDIPADYIERVKRVHESGGYGSIGFGVDWDIKEAKKLILRTHTTAVSSKMLFKLCQQPVFEPKKYFSIDRVFRNESTDATHLAEFHQVEGVIADYGLSLGNLIGVLDAFFKQIGITKLRYKPAYNPYTEPSMEIFGYHDGLNKWVEIGNSGMFRPEMLRPMGFPENVTVIAWGLSLERPTMIKYGINNIRTLIGHKIDLMMIKTPKICLL